MPTDKLSRFQNQNILLLQGPLGPFFRHFAEDLRTRNNRVFKINFNGGDAFFFPEGTAFRLPLTAWPDFLRDFIVQNQIETVFLFGDCRNIHIQAKNIAQSLAVEVYVFEEGYLRPNHITLEHGGVNGYSRFAPAAQSHLQQYGHLPITPPTAAEVGKTYWHAVWWAVIYYTAASFRQPEYPDYVHHRPLSMKEGFLWLRGAWRKQCYRWRERGMFGRLTGELAQQYFLVPLQVHNDAQISHHSPYKQIEDFIGEVIGSFATHAPENTHLVLKQHPFDRAYKDYSHQIARLAHQYAVQERIHYIHDQYLPDLLHCARGVVVINSTVGLSAVELLRPVKVCGQAVYNLPNLTAQCSLDEFWQQADKMVLDKNYVSCFLRYLCDETQHNGNFYRKIKNSGNSSGILWS